MRAIEDVAIDYLEGILPKTEHEAFEKLLTHSSEAQLVLKELEELYNAMDKNETPDPSSDLDDSFYKMLEAERMNQNQNNAAPSFGTSWLYGAIAALVLLLVGFGLGRYSSSENSTPPEMIAMQKEMEEIKQLVLMTLRKESASERLKAVHFTSQIKNVDNELLYALIHTMGFDNSLDVRIRAAESLSKFSDLSLVRDSYIKMLHQEESPEMQLLLIDLLVANNTQEALDEMYYLYEKENLPEFIKHSVRNGIDALSL